MKKSVSPVYWITLSLIFITVILGAVFPKSFQEITHNIQSYLTNTFGWYYLLFVSVIVIFCIFLIFSPVGKIKLGKDHDKPEYSNVSWFAMLFSAGMGIGLVFWGAAAPLDFYLNPPLADPQTVTALQDAMRFSFFHNGLHAWGIYAIVALALAYFKFRKGAPGLISATLTPIFGDRMNGRLGQAIDVLAVFATVIGVATTLGFGAKQINGGLSYLFDIPDSLTVQAAIIVVVTFLFLLSALSGLGKGIKYLSNINLILAIGLFALVVTLGPTVFIFDMFTESIGGYFQNLLQMSFDSGPLNSDYREWINNWTIFYWAWWIAWSPFVGIFIARVSKGRTIREFLIGVLLLPSLVAFLWYAAFGSTAINIQNTGITDLQGLPTEAILFGVFDALPGTTILSLVALVLICTFFITSADSATYVLGMQTTYGSLNPSFKVKLTWGIALSTISIILLYSGGLQGLQNALIIAAFPFSIIMVLIVVSLYRALSLEQKMINQEHRIVKKSA